MVQNITPKNAPRGPPQQRPPHKDPISIITAGGGAGGGAPMSVGMAEKDRRNKASPICVKVLLIYQVSRF